MVVWVWTVKEMVAFALSSTGCSFRANDTVLSLPILQHQTQQNELLGFFSPRPCCCWYIVHQAQFPFSTQSVFVLCEASHKTRRDTENSKSRGSYFAAAPALLQEPFPGLRLSSCLTAFLPRYKRHDGAVFTSSAVAHVTWLPESPWESY